MKTLITLAFLAMGMAAEAQTIQHCESADLVPGKGWVYKKVPCSEMERPIPCTKEWTDEKGHWNQEIIPCPPGTKQKTFEQEQREEEAAMKRKCGKDFGQLRVGMTMDRFEECNGAASYVTDTVGRGGVVETWRSTFYWIHVQNGRVVSYTRRTH